jgi:hypothetical protein
MAWDAIYSVLPIVGYTTLGNTEKVVGVASYAFC